MKAAWWLPELRRVGKLLAVSAGLLMPGTSAPGMPQASRARAVGGPTPCSLEFLTPLVPQHFLLLASLANVGKSIGAATGAAALLGCGMRRLRNVQCSRRLGNGSRPCCTCNSSTLLELALLTFSPPLLPTPPALHPTQASPPSSPRSPPSTAPSACGRTWPTSQPRRRWGGRVELVMLASTEELPPRAAAPHPPLLRPSH